MTYVVALVVYQWFYLVLYLTGPGIVAFWLRPLVPKNASWGAFVDVPMVGVFLGLLFLSGYRAKLAAGLFQGDIGFWKAHVMAGAILRAQLTFLPVIGPLFASKRNEDPRAQVESWRSGSGPPPPIE
jgi:hypothetical protein